MNEHENTSFADDLEEQIYDAVNSAVMDCYDSGLTGRMWGFRIKEALHDLGEMTRYIVMTDLTAKGTEKFIWDVTWLKGELDNDIIGKVVPKYKTFKEIVVACEILGPEDRGNLPEKFARLLASNGVVRVFVFATPIHGFAPIVNTLKGMGIGVGRVLVIGLPPEKPKTELLPVAAW